MTTTTIGVKQAPAEELPAHSPLGPSSSERWLKCLASVEHTKHMGDTASKFAAEGTAAHELSEWVRVQGKPAEDFLGQEIHADGFRFPVNWEMVHAVQKFVDYCARLEGDPYYEERVHYTAFVPNGWGTADDLRIGPTTYVTDLKYGKGIMVSAQDNSQLKLYALGVFQDFGHLYDIENFVLTVHQPRLDHVDVWEISTHDLLIWTRDVVVPAFERAMEPDPPFVPGEWCRFCPAKESCEARNNHMQELYLDDLDTVEEEMTPEQLGAIMDRLSLIRSWCNDKEAQAMSAINKGTPPIGEDGPYKLVEGRSSRKWKDESEAEKAMRAAKYKVSEIFVPRKLISAPAAEKLLGKKHEIIQTMVDKPAGKPALVKASDPRPALQIKAEEEFDDLENEE